MSRWFRFYDDVINDPKVLTLPEAMRWAWVAILCIASKHEGKLPHVDHIALMLRTNKQRAAATLAGLHNAGLLDKTEAGFEPHNWNGRQYVTDNSTTRVQKYRQKRKDAGLPVLGDYSVFRPSLEARDGKECVYCLKDNVPLVVDHMDPICLGGTDDLENLALACKACNSGKAGRTPEQAKMPVRVTSAKVSLERYRVRNHRVTVTETPPEAEDRKQIQIDDADERKRAFDLTEKLLAIAGHDPGFWPPGWMGAPMRVQTWQSRGWPDQVIESAVKAVCARKPPRSIGNVQYFEAAIAEEFARQSAPLPVVEIRQAEKLTVTHGKPKSAIIQAADDLCQRIASFDGPARVADELRSGEGETPPRLLSHG